MQKHQKKFTLEDMLSLKKAEKPSDAEWENFNAELKSKMLKAMVTPKRRFFVSPWAFAKIGAVAVPVIGVMLSFLASPSAIENQPTQNVMEMVQIPQMRTSYCSDSYFSSVVSSTEYTQDAIKASNNSGVVYATNDLMALGHLSF